jgi:ankyrin repeat protein
MRSHHTALQYAAKANNTHLVKLFIQHEASVNVQPAEAYGAAALQFAAISGNFEILNLLWDAGADINALRGSYKGRTAIKGAAE